MKIFKKNMMSYALYVYTYNFVVGLSKWNISYEYTYNYFYLLEK